MKESFDILFYRGTSPFAKAVAYITKSDITHAALVLDDYHIVETDWNKPVSVQHIYYRPEDYTIGRVEMTEEQREKLREFIHMTIDMKYDYKLVISHAMKYFFGGKLLNNPKRFDCSEWIDSAFLYAGIDLLPDVAWSTVTPAELYKSPKIKLLK